MPCLLDLSLENNNIKDIKPLANEEGFKTLKFLRLAGNKISEISQIKCPNLIFLDLNDNKIEKFETFDGHPKLITLSLRKNKISAATSLSNMPSLKELYLVLKFVFFYIFFVGPKKNFFFFLL